MSRPKGSKNKPKALKKFLRKVSKLKPKKRCKLMANVNDVLNAVVTLNTAVDVLIAQIATIPRPDTQPAIDAINTVTAKIQAIQVPS